jgi:hypothetical protein
VKSLLSKVGFDNRGPAQSSTADRAAMRTPRLGQRLHLMLVAFVLCDVSHVHAALAQLAPTKAC